MRRCAFVLVLVPLLVAAGAATTGPGGAVAFDFEKAEVGRVPGGFSVAVTGPGAGGEWKVIEDDTATDKNRVLAQVSKDETDQRFPVCVCDGVVGRDVAVSVRMKPVSGRVDRAGGVVVRYRDKDNYYVARANALEDNVRLYKVEGGRRTQIAGGNAKVGAVQWHTLKVVARGAHFEVQFDGKKVVEAEDETFKEAGKVGVWTKADSVTYFDGLAVTVSDEK